ncbi:hypothetical protein V8E52_010627 [Russula decolorans]|jgi:cytochrome c oxidase subunit 5b
MLHIALRSARASVLTARAGIVRPSSLFRPLLSVQPVALATTTLPHRQITASVPKPGLIPTNKSQSTGLDCVQVHGLLDRVDVFDPEPLDSSRIGTLADEMD